VDPAFQHDTYLVKRQFLALTGKLRIFDPTGRLALYVEQKMFRLREDIRVWGDETKGREILLINARTIIDFSAAYDVVDPTEGTKVGTLRRRGLKSVLRDEWEVLDNTDRPVGLLFEDSMGMAMLRRFLLGTLLPQNYDIVLGDMRVADLRQRFNPFLYHMDIDFTMDPGRRLDRRLGIAAGILLSIIEGKQQ
jgi:uncharacterized protein YxjI